MRESNFSNPFQNKASVCISAAVYDRRALDCTATLPLINSLNHLAYLTSTSPRIRDSVCIDGGLERLIRILRLVPRSPSQPPMRGVITKEMQAVWKWSLAFQCVVNIGVRGSETVRTRVVEAGMVPVAVRVLESYLRVADAIRDERKREARREEAKARLENAAESAMLAMDVATPTVANTRRADARNAALGTPAQWPQIAAPNATATTAAPIASTALAGVVSHLASQPDETRPTTPAEGAMGDFNMATSNSSSSITAHNDVPLPSPTSGHHGPGDGVAPIMPAIDAISVEISAVPSPVSSPSSVGTGPGTTSGRRSAARDVPSSHLTAVSGTGTLTNVSSVEDFTTSGSGSDGADEAEMEAADDSDSASTTAPTAPGQQDNAMDTLEERTTPRPHRRPLAPVTSSSSTSVHQTTDASASASGTAHRAHHSRSRQQQQAPVPTALTTPTVATTNAAQRHVDPAQTPRNAAGAQMPLPQPLQVDRHGAAREVNSQTHPSDMIYREEEVLLSLQLLAYLSKYAHVRTLFHRDLATLNMLDPLDALDDKRNGATSSNNVSWSPNDQPKKNVFCIAERYTLRSSRTGLSHFASMGESRIAPEIQYWAGVIMRNACRKDEKQGGIRQCANMLCGKWEKQPREFAKCRRCRKAKYCSKQCQSKGWQMGHRFWCSARSDDEHGESKDRTKAVVAPTGPGGEGAGAAQPTLSEDEAAQRQAHRHLHHAHHNHAQQHAAPQGEILRLLTGADHETEQTRLLRGVHPAQNIANDETGLPARNDDHHRRPATNVLTSDDVSDPLSSDMTDGSQEMRRSETVTARTELTEEPMSYDGTGAAGMAPLHVARRGGQQPNGASTFAGPSMPSLSRRAVSAIPQHLQIPSHSGSDRDGSSSRSRTVSAASSNADASDMSEDEMERASRRVLASTIAPVQRSPATTYATLGQASSSASDTTRGNGGDHASARASIGNGGAPMASIHTVGAEGGVPTRTDLAGRPLPPPVIAQHDVTTNLDLTMAPDNDLLTMGGRLTPAVGDDVDAGVFGRGDFDQMIWRGRTPALEDGMARMPHRRGAFMSDTDTEAADSAEGQEQEMRTSRNGTNMSRPTTATATSSYDNSPSMLNSALLLAGQEDASSTPRFPSGGLHAPIARQPHRFASVNTASSPSASTSSLIDRGNMHARAAAGPSSASSFSRSQFGQAFGTSQGHVSASPRSGQQHPHVTHTFSSVQRPSSQGERPSSSLLSGGGGGGAESPMSANAFAPPARADTADRDGDFVVPNDIQALFSTVEMRTAARDAPLASSNDMDIDT